MGLMLCMNKEETSAGSGGQIVSWGCRRFAKTLYLKNHENVVFQKTQAS